MKMKISELLDPSVVVRPIIAFEQRMLEESMSEVGLLTPLVVATDSTIVDGWRRWLAAQALGWKTLDVNVVEGDPEQLRIVCQTRQSDFGRSEKKALLALYLDRKPDATAGEIAKAFKWSPQEIEELACWAYATKPVQEAYAAGEITLSAVWAMGRLQSESQLQVWDACEDRDALQELAESHLRIVKSSRRRITSSRPRVKTYRKIESEIEKPVYAGAKLISSNAKTPLDGWIAALKWAIEQK